MNPLWAYVWPVLGLGLIVGIIAGAIGFRLSRIVQEDKFAAPPPITARQRRKRVVALFAGAIACIAASVLWHGPIGSADRFTSQVERDARTALDNYEMTKVTARLHRGPLTRRLILAGPADDFQTAELVRIMDTLPGISGAQWTSAPAGAPLLLEGIVVTLMGFLLGLLLAYLVELRRRYNAQWNW